MLLIVQFKMLEQKMIEFHTCLRLFTSLTSSSRKEKPSNFQCVLEQVTICAVIDRAQCKTWNAVKVKDTSKSKFYNYQINMHQQFMYNCNYLVHQPTLEHLGWHLIFLYIWKESKTRGFKVILMKQKLH